MQHSFHKGSNEDLIIMLHGTGGSVDDLLEIAKMIDPQAHYMGILGTVLENNMRRYFKRYPDGTFDLEDLDKQTHTLYETMKTLVAEHGFSLDQVSIIAYSNGANIFINLLKTYETDIKNAILFHPSSVKEHTAFKPQTNLKVFTSFGKDDPFIKEASYRSLKKELADAGIEHTSYETSQGHQLTIETINAAKAFYIEERQHESI